MHLYAERRSKECPNYEGGDATSRGESNQFSSASRGWLSWDHGCLPPATLFGTERLWHAKHALNLKRLQNILRRGLYPEYYLPNMSEDDRKLTYRTDHFGMMTTSKKTFNILMAP